MGFQNVTPAWSGDEDGVLRTMQRSGESYAAIARQLGRTRNAVVGRAHRLGLCEPRPKLAPPPKVVVTDQVGTAPCRFIEGDGPFRGTDPYCNAAAQIGSSYCPVHHMRCHTRPGAREMETYHA